MPALGTPASRTSGRRGLTHVHRGVEASDALRHVADVLAGDAAGTGGTQSASQVAVAQDGDDRRRQGLGIVLGDHERGLVRGHVLGNATVIGGHDGTSRRLGFEVDHEERLGHVVGRGPARADDQTGGAHGVPDATAIGGSFDRGPGRADDLLERPEAQRSQAGIGHRGHHIGPGSRQHVETLLLHESTHEQDLGLRRERGGSEELGVDAAADDVDPFAWDAEFHRPPDEELRGHDHRGGPVEDPHVGVGGVIEPAVDVVAVEGDDQGDPQDPSRSRDPHHFVAVVGVHHVDAMTSAVARQPDGEDLLATTLRHVAGAVVEAHDVVDGEPVEVLRWRVAHHPGRAGQVTDQIPHERFRRR